MFYLNLNSNSIGKSLLFAMPLNKISKLFNKNGLPSNQKEFLIFLSKEKGELDLQHLSKIIHNVYGLYFDLSTVLFVNFLLSVLLGSSYVMVLNLSLTYPILVTCFVSIIIYILLMRIWTIPSFWIWLINKKLIKYVLTPHVPPML